MTGYVTILCAPKTYSPSIDISCTVLVQDNLPVIILIIIIIIIINSNFFSE